MSLLASGEHSDPHRLLGVRRTGNDILIRALCPGSMGVSLIVDGMPKPIEMSRLHPIGIYEANLVWTEPDFMPAYRFSVEHGSHAYEMQDPYRFLATLDERDTRLFAEGRHQELWKHLGSHVRTHQGVHGVSFAVWAPNALSVRVVGDFNRWDGRSHPMRLLGSSGVWEIFVPALSDGARYKYELLTSERRIVLKTDPFAFEMESPPKTASIVTSSSYEWADGGWIDRRRSNDPTAQPLSIYECHIGSWRRNPDQDNRSLTYRELAEELTSYLTDLGFTHVEFLPVSEHPFRGSWGYQVSAYYAPSHRFGTPDDFRYLVDRLHQAGIGVIIDWVPAHFPRDAFALARFDGTALYEHADPRQGHHPDWGTLVFNLGRNEVKNFLSANALYWIEEFHADGIRVDAVASMLHLDYSREPGEWVPNRYGGRENLDSVAFFKELNTLVYGKFPGVMTIAEESTSWPAVSRPTYVGGLGFGFKWSLGWMHDTLNYFMKDPVHRRFHHNDLTFALMYAWAENFVLPLSHDEVVHGKGSLFQRMPGDRWQKMANLRALFAWMWAHPGKQLLFMGGEFAQESEWSHDRSLDWHLLGSSDNKGIQDLVRSLNLTYAKEPALWERDFEQSGFRWIDANDSDTNVLSFIRYNAAGDRYIVCVANLAPVPRYGYRLGLPRGGPWHEVLNTDSHLFGGSGVSNLLRFDAEGPAWHGFDRSADVTLPPLGVVWLAPMNE
ncbi:MAG: 1,4-alpha-glucan branching protein GlgB [Actinobacteria bacterium]|nr:1,4-alpha-glucan branching protein GlgB [Actinomycetota bacterium]